VKEREGGRKREKIRGNYFSLSTALLLPLGGKKTGEKNKRELFLAFNRPPQPVDPNKPDS